MKKLALIIFLGLLFACSNSSNKPDDWYIGEWKVDKEKTLNLGSNLTGEKKSTLNFGLLASKGDVYKVSESQSLLYQNGEQIRADNFKVIRSSKGKVILRFEFEKYNKTMSYDENGEFMDMIGWITDNGVKETYKLKLYLEKLN